MIHNQVLQNHRGNILSHSCTIPFIVFWVCSWWHNEIRTIAGRNSTSTVMIRRLLPAESILHLGASNPKWPAEKRKLQAPSPTRRLKNTTTSHPILSQAIFLIIQYLRCAPHQFDRTIKIALDTAMLIRDRHFFTGVRRRRTCPFFPSVSPAVRI